MQVRFRCKRASKPHGDLDEDRIVDATLLLKPSHHLAEFFNQPLPPALICIYSWIPIQRSMSLACTITPKSCLHISKVHIAKVNNLSSYRVTKILFVNLSDCFFNHWIWIQESRSSLHKNVMLNKKIKFE
jgi:hypothetical protein